MIKTITSSVTTMSKLREIIHLNTNVAACMLQRALSDIQLN